MVPVLEFDQKLNLCINTSQEQGKLIEIECLEYEYEMKKNGTEIVTYTKGVVEVRSLTLREKYKF